MTIGKGHSEKENLILLRGKEKNYRYRESKKKSGGRIGIDPASFLGEKFEAGWVRNAIVSAEGGKS